MNKWTDDAPEVAKWWQFSFRCCGQRWRIARSWVSVKRDCGHPEHSRILEYKTYRCGCCGRLRLSGGWS